MSGGRMVYALAQLSGRERVLLLLLGAVVIPVAVAFLAVMPLLQTRDGAARAADEARAVLGWVSQQVRIMPAEGAQALEPPGAGGEPIGLTGIEDSLVRIGLRDFVSQLSNRSGGGVDLTLEAAPFERLGDWLQAMVPLWGYELEAFRIEAASPGLVNASFVLGAGE